MKLRTLGLASAVPALLLASTVAQASVRPESVSFGTSSQAPLAMTGERKSIAVASENALKRDTAVVAFLAALFAGLGLYYALRDTSPD